MEHVVEMASRKLYVGKVPVTFDVWAGDEKLGTLKVSKGLIQWRHRTDTKAHYLEWSTFDQLMVDNSPKD